MQMIALKKTDLSLAPHTSRALERNQFCPDSSARINQMVARYDFLVTYERESVVHLVDNDFLKYVVGEWLETYPIQFGLVAVVDGVYQERKFDGYDVPAEVDFKSLMEQLKALSILQQITLVEMIEEKLA